MPRFLKYELPIEDYELIKPLLIDCSLVELGSLIEGHIALDILWNNDEAEGMQQYQVFPKDCGCHTFLGLEHLYENEFNNQ